MDIVRSTRRVLWSLACTDEEAARLSTPMAKFYQDLAGCLIFVTGVLALVSGTYAISQIVFMPAAVFLGAVYALGIVSIDRFIVASHSRVALLRLPLAIVLGAVISVPIELRILEPRINKELAKQEHDDNRLPEQRRTAQLDALRTRIDRLEQDVAKYRAKVNQWGETMEAEVVGRVRQGSTGRSGEGAAYHAAEEQKRLNSELLDEATAELERLKGEKRDGEIVIEKEFERAKIPQAYDLLARYEALNAIEKQDPDAYKMTWAITIVLILLEVFPALLKMSMPKSAYVAMVKMREEEEISRILSIAQQNLQKIAMKPDDPAWSVIRRLEEMKSPPSRTRMITRAR